MLIRSRKRKIRVIILIVALILFFPLLLSCLIRVLTYGKYEFLHESESYENMIIQIVDISEGYDLCVEVSVADLKDKITVITAIDDKEAFMEELQQVDHNYPLGTPPFGLSAGKAVLLTYSDGAQELIAREGCALLAGETAEIIYHGWFAFDSYYSFIEKWISSE